MKNSPLTLFLEINRSNFNFFVSEKDGQNNFKICFNLSVPLVGIDKNRISNFEKVFSIIKENIFFIEEKLNFTFREIVLILDNFNPTFISISGYKKLSGSQILKENIIYLLNTLKSLLDKIESKKTILHIFNTNFYLDNKKIDNLPIGLFGDFYSHELSFVLINTNDHKNLESIINNCNLKLKKILLKSFIEGVNIISNHKGLDTFYNIKIKNDNSKIFFFENNSIKYQQDFKFGTDIIIKDVSKITSLRFETVKNIIEKIELNEGISKNELIEEKFFKEDNYIKIKKKLMYEIISARVKEISEILVFKNINLRRYNNYSKIIFLEFNSKFLSKSVKDIYKTVFSNNDTFDINYLDFQSDEKVLNTANKLVHFGWKNEAIPVLRTQKSLIARLFNAIFG